MGFTDYSRDLTATPFDLESVLHRYYHSGQSVIFTGADPNEEPKFKRKIGELLDNDIGIKCHPLQLVICGSAHLGFSPVPKKLGNPFDNRTSDVDIAVVSDELFDKWWLELQGADIDEFGLRGIANDLFRGYIDPFKVRMLSVTGKRWWKLFGDFKYERANGVRGRVYRSFWNMQNYHRNAILLARDKLLGVRT